MHCKYIDCQKYNFLWDNVSHALPVPFRHLITVPSTTDNSSCIFGNIFYIIQTVVCTFKPVHRGAFCQFPFSGILQTVVCTFKPVHIGAFCQFPFRWVYYYCSNKSTGKETGKTYLSVKIFQKMRTNNERVAKGGAFDPCDFKVEARKKARIGNSSWLARKKTSSSSDP